CSKTTNHRAFQPVAPTASLLSLHRCRCERRDISENPEPWQAFCENILKTHEKAPSGRGFFIQYRHRLVPIAL
ncbi:hypothetical protein, partial [Pandoraea pnomenusa]|uniref:hypothetical protein n=1 Tax=Pandoraea pnomenusa TaxID=93220 RepID=UPI0033420D63